MLTQKKHDMRILIIHNQYQHTGGEDVVVEQEIKHLSETHEVELYQVKNQKGIKGYLQYFFYPFNWTEMKSVSQVLDRFKPDLVHIHNLHYAIGPGMLRHIKRKHSVPLVMTLHNFRLLCPSATLFFQGHLFLNSLSEDFPWTAVKKKVLEHSFLKTFWTAVTYWLHKKTGTFQRVDRYILLSAYSSNLFKKSTLALPEDKMRIKPNFVEWNEQPNSQHTEDFVYAGRLSEEKGILPLLHAWKATNFRIKVFGTGPLLEEVKEIAKHNPHIAFYGHQDRAIVQAHIAECSAVIVPSLCYETMPLSILEAFAQGIPVLASQIGILAEIVVPLHTGLLFDPHNHPQLIKTLVEWKSLPQEKLIAIRQNCRNEYLEKYSKHQVMAQLENIYLELVPTSK